MMTRCFSLLLGARNTPAGGKRFSRRDEAQIREITFRHFPEGFTILNAEGGWFDPSARRFVEEESRQILVCSDSSAALRAWCRELAAALQQQELLVMEIGPAVTFRAGERTGAQRAVPSRPIRSQRRGGRRKRPRG